MESPPTPPLPTVVLDGDSLDQLNKPEAKALLDTIDSLREIQVSDIVNLPQIIVVGDQSSGKSSVLEAISGVQFPVDDDVCTCFATELILRRAPGTSVNVSIQFADDAPSAARGDALRQPFRRSTFNKRDLPDIIKEAKERMGMRQGGILKFSSNVLRIEISASDVYPLTLVDLPGIFHSATANQDMEGKAIVHRLVDNYMRQPKSIILAVVAANNPLANQLVLEKAQTHDPNRARTIGVITKPDLAGSKSERIYLDLAKGRESMHKLALGWYVLRNRSEAERLSKTEARDAAEERFFRTGAWSSISLANRGVESLRKRLSKVLFDHIKTSLPSVIEDITANLSTRQEELNRLGRSRSTPDELRLYLLHVADKYQRLARDAIGGRYNDKFFGGIEEQKMKLRARLRNLNRAFDLLMTKRGGRYRIVSDKRDSNSDSGGNDEEEYPEYLRAVVEEYGAPEPETKTDSELVAKLQKLASLNQGMEFPGEANSNFARQLFMDQAAPWHGIAWAHLELALKVSQEFVEGAFIHITGVDESTSGAIVNDFVDPFFEAKREKLRAKLEELLHPYARGCGLPLEDEFRRNLRGIALQRLGRRIAERLKQKNTELFRPITAERHIQEALRDLDKAESDNFGSSKVIEMMKAFYDISLRTFTDNVINLAVERCLVYHIPTLFTSEDIHKMTIEKLQELASESEEVRTQRLALQDEVRILKDGLQSLAEFPRRSRGVESEQILSGTATASPSPTLAGNATPPLVMTSASQQRPIPGNATPPTSSTVPSGTNTSHQLAASPTRLPQASPNPVSSAPTILTQAWSAEPLFPSVFGAPVQVPPDQTDRSNNLFSTSQSQAEPTPAVSIFANSNRPYFASSFSTPNTRGASNTTVTTAPTATGSGGGLFDNLTFSNVSSNRAFGSSGSSNNVSTTPVPALRSFVFSQPPASKPLGTPSITTTGPATSTSTSTKSNNNTKANGFGA